MKYRKREREFGRKNERGDVGRGGCNQLETDGEEEQKMIGRQDG